MLKYTDITQNRFRAPEMTPTKKVFNHLTLFCVVCQNSESKETKIMNVLGEKEL
jgi:hypothetical protein